MDFPILSAVTFTPLAGAILILLIKGLTGPQTRPDGSEDDRVLYAGLMFSVATFVGSIIMFLSFDLSGTGYQLVEEADWFAGIKYKMGVDGMSLLLILLTTLLTPIALIASIGSIKHRLTEFTVVFLVLETFMIGVFCALDLVVFYVFFEAGLIPMFIIIGVWGGVDRIYAGFKFFLYTLLGSLFMLAAVVYMYLTAGTSDVAVLEQFEFAKGAQTWLWLAFFASFAVKLPMWPVHTWLPDAHVQAPTAGSC